MMDFLNKRRHQREEAQAQVISREALRDEKLAWIKSLIAPMKELLKDQRYAFYRDLLVETQRSLVAEREAVLRGQDDGNPDTRHDDMLLLTGRIMQLEYILEAPENFLKLAEQPETHGGPLRPQHPELAARSQGA